MESFVNLAVQLNNVSPSVLVSVVSIVALLVVAECVRQLSKVIAQKEGKK